MERCDGWLAGDASCQYGPRVFVSLELRPSTPGHLAFEWRLDDVCALGYAPQVVSLAFFLGGIRKKILI